MDQTITLIKLMEIKEIDLAPIDLSRPENKPHSRVRKRRRRRRRT